MQKGKKSLVHPAGALGWAVAFEMKLHASRATSPVAQICNLLYRRLVVGSVLDSRGRLGTAHALQNAILRYSRLQICATQLRASVMF